MIKKAIILTGFEKFDNYSSNLSSDIVKNLNDEFQQFSLEKIILPVSWKRSIKLYQKFLNSIEFRPSLVILLGIHSKKRISFEKLALNWKSGKDMDGHYKFGFINIKKSLKFNTILNLKDIYTALKFNIKMSISHFPGFYLCNYIYYRALDISKNEYPVIFIHIPRTGKLEDFLAYIKIIIETIIKKSKIMSFWLN